MEKGRGSRRQSGNFSTPADHLQISILLTGEVENYCTAIASTVLAKKMFQWDVSTVKLLLKLKISSGMLWVLQK